jgi:hypothetical protein
MRRPGWRGTPRAYGALVARRCPHARWAVDLTTLRSMLDVATVTVRSAAGTPPPPRAPRLSAAETVRRYVTLGAAESCDMLSDHLLRKVYGPGDALAACRRARPQAARAGCVVVTGVAVAGDTAVVTFDLPGEAQFGNSHLLVSEGGVWKIDGPRA